MEVKTACLVTATDIDMLWFRSTSKQSVIRRRVCGYSTIKRCWAPALSNPKGSVVHSYRPLSARPDTESEEPGKFYDPPDSCGECMYNAHEISVSSCSLRFGVLVLGLRILSFRFVSSGCFGGSSSSSSGGSLPPFPFQTFHFS